MQAGARAGFVLAVVAILAAMLSAPAALASDSSTPPIKRQRHQHSAQHSGVRLASHMRHVATGLQCVPFARAESGIVLKGNAANWWDAAAGVYDRGSRPEAGAVLNFRSTGHMRLGHVAVVTNVLSAREIEIDHANWTRFEAIHGNVSLAMHVVDVSPDNDWTAVRVELGHTGTFGAVYPTYGFIYDRPDTGMMVANSLATLHPTQERPALDADEVAEAPRAHAGAEALAVDAPDRSLR